MATDVMKLNPTPEEIITKHNLKFSRYFQNALTTKYTEFMDNTPSDIDPRLVTEVYLKMYQYAAYTFYPSESASMNTLYNLYHCFKLVPHRWCCYIRKRWQAVQTNNARPTASPVRNSCRWHCVFQGRTFPFG